MRISISSRVLPTQGRFLASKRRFPAYIGGYGAGKTWVNTYKCLKMVVQNPNCAGLYVAPTYAVIRDVTLPLMKDHLHRAGFAFQHNKSENNIHLPQFNAVIHLRSAERPELIKGLTVAWASLDEVALLPEELWGIVISRIRDPKAQVSQVFVTGTPEGMNWVYEKWEEAPPDEEYDLYQTSTRENILISDEYAKMLEASLPADEIEQKLYGQFADTGKGFCYARFYSDENKSIWSPFAPEGSHKTIVSELPIVLMCDFNVTFARWLIGQHKDGLIYIADEIAMDDVFTHQMIEEFFERGYGDHPSGVIVYGDPAGRNRSTTSSKTDYDLLSENGLFDQNVPRSAPLVKDRVVTVNGRLLNSAGVRNILINPSCKALIKDLKRVKWKEGSAGQIEKNKNPELTHASDALGYFICQEYPISGFYGKSVSAHTSKF